MNRTPLLAALLGVLVLVLAACGGGDGDAAGDAGDGAETTTSASGDVLSLTGTDDLKYDKTELTAEAGTITVELACEDGVAHDFVVEEAGDTTVVECGAGETSTGTIDLEPGTYTYYCSIPGHRTAGMEGTLTVQ